MTDELLIPIVSSTTRQHIAAEDDAGAIASIEIMLEAHRRVVVHVTPDDDDVTVELRVKNA